MKTTIDILDIDAMHFPLVREFEFGPDNNNWINNLDHNQFFLVGIQNLFNDVLQARGYVFLNDILKALGISPTPVGQLIGWTKRDNGHIDLGIHEVEGLLVVRPNFQGVILDALA